MKKKIGIVFLNEPNFSELACRFLVLHLNKIQESFQFEFPECKEYSFAVSGPSCIRRIAPVTYSTTNLFEKLFKVVDGMKGIDYFIGLTTVGIDENKFWDKKGNITIITTDTWERYFAPPSVFEYIVHSIAGALVQMMSNEKTSFISSHREGKGCLLDYTYFKEERKVSISLGCICDECLSRIEEVLGKDISSSIQKITSRKWIGQVSAEGFPAFELKKFYRVDIEKDTGFNKTFWEKAKDYLPEIPKEVVIIIATAFITSIVTYLFTR